MLMVVSPYVCVRACVPAYVCVISAYFICDSTIHISYSCHLSHMTSFHFASYNSYNFSLALSHSVITKNIMLVPLLVCLPVGL